MSATSNLRKQHNDLLAIATELSTKLKPETLSENASEARTMLSKLAGKLQVHLSMEDKSLYPALLKHSDESIKKTAESFIAEMGGIGTVLKKYLDKWHSAEAIQSDANGFITETGGIFNALSKRIEKEDRELYPLVDELGL